MKERILAALAATDEYLSGQQLSDLLGVSRTAVWKAIGKLKEEGYEIEAVTNRGYRLINHEKSDVLNAGEIDRRLTTKWAGRPVCCVKETGSTNTDIMRKADAGAAEGTLAVASRQTAGRGRRGRTWDSPDAGNVYMSILLRPQIPVQQAPMITLVMALAVHEAMEELFGAEDRTDVQKTSGTRGAIPAPPAPGPDAARSVRFGIKWPNDLVVSSGGGPYLKFAGILTEMRLEDATVRDVTVGIGLNLNMEDVEEPLRAGATTLSRALGRRVNRAEVTAACWNHFEPLYEEFLTAGSMISLRERYECALVNKGRRVRVLDPQGEFTGTAGGITPQGELIVQPDDASQARCIGTGEISVRGVMGYV